MLFYLLLQAAAPPPADVYLGIHLRARSVQIERQGEAELSVRAKPDGGSVTEAVATPSTEGSEKLRNVEVKVRAEARIAAPAQTANDRETPAPQ